MDDDRLPPMPQRMFDLLKDGTPHVIDELVALLGDDQATEKNVQPHLNRVRRWLNPQGYALLCEFGPSRQREGKTVYRIVRYATSPIKLRG